MAQSDQSKPVLLLPILLITIVPSIIALLLLISPIGGYKLQQYKPTMSSSNSRSGELLENDENDEGTVAAQIDQIFKAMDKGKDELMVEWPQGWRRFLLQKFGRALPISGTKAKAMPCCSESIGQHVCNELRNRNPLLFRRRCKTDADFAILQCCRSCRTNVAELGRELFVEGQKSRHCFDRHNRNFCAHFVHQSGLWAANVAKSVNCNGDGAPLAFRVCRRSCGFCEPELYQKQQNHNCISNVWKMTSRTIGTTPTAKGISSETNGEHWKSKSAKTTTTEQPHAFSKSSSSSKKTTKLPDALSKKPTKSANCTSLPSPRPPSSSFPLIVPPSTRRPIATSPPFHPGTVPPLPPLPPIPVPLPPWRPSPCRPLEPLAPLNSLTPATIATTTYSAPKPMPTANPFPLLPLPPVEPVGRRRSGTTITITWKPSPSGDLWPKLPIPLPDEIIEAILNKLSGIDDSDGGCRECNGKVRKEKGEQTSVGSRESAEKREEKGNSAEKSEQNGEGEEEEEVQQQVIEDGVGLLMELLLKAAKWVGTTAEDGEKAVKGEENDQEEEEGDDQTDQQQRDQWTDRRRGQ